MVRDMRHKLLGSKIATQDLNTVVPQFSNVSVDEHFDL